MIKTTYADTVSLKCTDNGKVIEAEVMEFRPAHILSVSVQRSIKLILKYNAKGNNYVGSMSGLEFITDGPKETVTYQGRIR